MRIHNRLCDITALGGHSLVILALVTCSTAIAADPATRVYKIGFLGQTTATDLSRQTGALRQGFRDLGYEEAGTYLSNTVGLSGNWIACQISRLSLLL